MLANYLCGNCQTILQDYLEHKSNLVILQLDPKLRIINYNRGFLKLIGTAPPDHTCITNYLLETSRQELYKFLEEEQPHFRLSIKGQEDNFYMLEICHYPLQDSYLLFGEIHALSGADIIQKFSVLNNELTNTIRELNKKNRELEKSNDTINRLLRIDPLTNLYNRRFFFEELEKTFSLLKRHGLPASLATMDLDHFKEVNDKWGHLIGDRVLSAFARLLQEETREEDIPARMGGEEFTVLLENTSLDYAATFAERMRQAWFKRTVPPVDTPLTVSIGITQLKAEDTMESALFRADQAMYRAKEKGRNRVEKFR